MKNLSASGLCLSAASFLPRGVRIVLLLSLPRLLKPIRMIGRVAWMRQQRFSEGCDFGLQFIEIASEDRDKIAGFVERGVVAS